MKISLKRKPFFNLFKFIPSTLTVSRSFIFPCVFILFFSCKKNNPANANTTSLQYNTSGNLINNYTKPVQLIGADAFHVFSAGSRDMNNWNLDIAREFIGNVEQTPLSGSSVQDSTGAYLYSLQTIADSNRVNNRITIICGFGWNGTPATVFSGLSPANTYWWNSYKQKLKQWAVQFINQPDVWLEVWNEPYNYNRTDGYTDDTWMNDMNDLVSVIRSTGNNNIILVPCAEQGQDESVLNNKGTLFLSGKTNILFDIHAYEKWLLDSNSDIGNRLELLKQNNLPVIFGEIAPLNAGTLMNPQPFLDSVYNRGISLCAWVWKYSNNDVDALLDSAGLPNNVSNNNWGTVFKNLAQSIRKP